MNNWEEEFDKKFINDNYIYSTGNFNSIDPVVNKLKKFIKELRARDKEILLSKLGGNNNNEYSMNIIKEYYN